MGSSVASSCGVGHHHHLHQEEHQGHPVGVGLSGSVDSIVVTGADSVGGGNKCVSTGGGTIFSPVSALPKGLPPKSPGMGCLQESSGNKCKSLERDQKGNKLIIGSSAGDCYVGGKYTPLGSDSISGSSTNRCKSLDRREVKQSKVEEKLAKEREKAEKEKEKKAQKSLVGSKAAFFGGLLTRRSPSPCRQKEKEKESGGESKVPVIQGRTVRFPFGKGGGNSGSGSNSSSQTELLPTPQQSPHSPDPVTSSDCDIDTAFLDMQGRSSQRNRISKWSLSSSNLASVQEQTKLASGCDSPWSQRRSGGEPTGSSASGRGGGLSGGSPSPTPPGGEEKKWGKIVKTPFGLRYTFGSPRFNDSNSSAGSK